MNKIIRIGTRDSRLALWQAGEASKGLSTIGYLTSIVPVKSDGDVDTITPLYETGIQGIFTKALDTALLENRIDIAVHSYKDVPTSLAKGLYVAAVLKRQNPFDVLVCKDERALEEVRRGIGLTIASSSIRRKAQWLHKYQNSRIENIRGNVQTRLEKLRSSGWHGTILAAAGLRRLEFGHLQTGPQLQLDWMLPAPAQGAIVIVCRDNDHGIISACESLNDEVSALCTKLERDFLRLLQGGCTTPISALAVMDGEDIYFKGNITATDGSESISISLRERRENLSLIAEAAVKEIRANSTTQVVLQ